jgi:NADH-quinone oxidoreductase subunit H
MVVEWVIKAVVFALVLTVGFAYGTLFERRTIAALQVRIGPNRAGPQGIIQPIADGIKLMFKESFTPAGVSKVLYTLAPILAAVPSLIIAGVVPWGGDVVIGGRIVPLYITNVNVGVLYLLTIASISVYGIVLGGWASNNKYALMGGLRSAAQMISYELSLGLSIMVPALLAGSMSLVDIVNAQHSIWYIVLQPLAFIIYFITSTAEINRPPFDLAEAEQEISEGFNVEYGGMKFAVYYMAEYVELIAIALIGSSLFLGGFYGPGVDTIPWLGPIYLLIKVGIWFFVLVWIRATFPRIRYDRLMSLGWKVLFPLSLVNLLLTAGVLLATGG